MNIEGQLHLAIDIASAPVDVETLETYETQIGHYQSKDFTYIPMPKDMKYHNTEEGWVRDINEKQIILEDTHLMEVLRKMQNYPFLLIDFLQGRQYYEVEIGGNIELFNRRFVEDNPFDSDTVTLSDSGKTISFEEIQEKVGEKEPLSVHDVREKHPEIAKKELNFEYDEQYGIITLVDLNSRGMKQMLYKVISQLASELGDKIESKYPDSNNILKHMRPITIGRWEKDRINGLNMHISEHMNLLEMMQVIQSSDGDFVEDCGFSSKSDVQTLNKINEIRNRVMHANRSLIYERKDISDILEVVNESERILSD